MTKLPASLFERENPFTLENASAADIEIMPWATEWSGRVPYTLKRGLLFQDGRRLAQLVARSCRAPIEISPGELVGYDHRWTPVFGFQERARGSQ